MQHQPQPRVLQLVTTRNYAGLERHVVQLGKELATLGCITQVACPPSATRMREEVGKAGLLVLPRVSGGSRGYAWLAALARQVMRDPPDVIHTHDGRASIAGLVLSRMMSRPLVKTQHFTLPASVVRSGAVGGLSLAAHRKLSGSFDAYIAVSESVARAAEERGEAAPGAIEVIPPGVELASEEAYREATLRRMSRHPFTVAFVGRLEPERELHNLIQAIPAVLAEFPETRFVIAGDGAAAENLRGQATALGINHAVDWLGWIPDSHEVMVRTDVYVNTLPWEGFGMATAEAMSYGLPVVAVNSGASAELVLHETTGLLVADRSPAAFANAMCRLARDREHAAKMGVAGRTRALGEYGVDRTARDVLACYRQLRPAAERRR